MKEFLARGAFLLVQVLFAVLLMVAVQHRPNLDCFSSCVGECRAHCLQDRWLNQHPMGLEAVPGWVIILVWLGIDLLLVGLSWQLSKRRADLPDPPQPWWKQESVGP